MEDVLAMYTRPRDPDIPLVCLDETSKQLIAETRAPVPMKPGQPARSDYEYERNGTANLFMVFAPLEGWRHVKVTDRHTGVDYTYALKDLSDTYFPDARKIIFVQDNLSTHRPASLYEAFPAAEARRLVERFEWPRQSTAVGSIWRNPNSASFRPSASNAASRINTPSSKKSRLGRTIEMSTTPRPTGNSPQPTHVSNSSIYTRQSD
jgi:hypothetical protein